MISTIQKLYNYKKKGELTQNNLNHTRLSHNTLPCFQCPHDGFVYLLVHQKDSDIIYSSFHLNQNLILEHKLIHRTKHLPIRSFCKAYLLIFLHDSVNHLKPEAFILQIVAEMNKKLLLYVLQVSLQDFGYKEGIQGLFIGEHEAFSPVYPE